MSEPEIVTAAKSVSDFTLRHMLPLWLDNLAENLKQIRNGLGAESLPKRKEPCIVVAAGPSLTKLHHLEMIQNHAWTHTMLACDKMLSSCLTHSLLPYAVGTVDGTNKILPFYESLAIRNETKRIAALFSVFTHPDVVKTWKKHHGQIYWWTPLIDAIVTNEGRINPTSLTYAIHLMTKLKGIISGAGNVGAFLWNMACALDCDPIILVGFDFSEQIVDKANAIYFDGFTRMFLESPSPKGDKYRENPVLATDAAADMHQVEVNPDVVSECDYLPFFRKGEHPKYVVNPIWKHYRNILAEHVVSSGRHTINCTGNGCLHTEAKDDDGNYILKVPNFESRNLRDVLEEYK